jgi:hypothetical protein
VELFGELVNFMLNENNRKPPLIFQDKMSVIDMVISGGGVTRTKHTRTRLYLILEAVKENRIEIKRIGMKEIEFRTIHIGGATPHWVNSTGGRRIIWIEARNFLTKSGDVFQDMENGFFGGWFIC